MWQEKDIMNYSFTNATVRVKQ